MKIEGKKIAQNILAQLKKEIAKKKTKPHLAIIIIGKNPASISYVKQKIIKAKEIGIETTLIALNEKITEKTLIDNINKLNNNERITGIIVQKPLPENIDNKKINSSINPQKDIDSFNPSSKFTPPIGLAVLEILKYIYKDLNILKNKKIIVLGKGETGGKPINKTFLKLGIIPVAIDSKTKNIEKIIKLADIIISAVGKKEIIKAKYLKKGVILIGIGQHLEKGEFCGDYNENEIKKIASFYTTTPGGMGPVNVSMLLKNLLERND